MIDDVSATRVIIHTSSQKEQPQWNKQSKTTKKNESKYMHYEDSDGNR